MGDLADDFRAYREYKNRLKMDRAAENRVSVFQSGFQYTRVDREETHFHITMPDGSKVSFWPPSGAWRPHKKDAVTRYGWKDLVRYAEKLKAKA